MSKTVTTRIAPEAFQVKGDSRTVIVAKDEDGLWSLTIDGQQVRRFFAKRDALHFYTLTEAAR